MSLVCIQSEKGLEILDGTRKTDEGKEIEMQRGVKDGERDKKGKTSEFGGFRHYDG